MELTLPFDIDTRAEPSRVASRRVYAEANMGRGTNAMGSIMGSGLDVDVDVDVDLASTGTGTG